jgi:hypothetical protein
MLTMEIKKRSKVQRQEGDGNGGGGWADLRGGELGANDDINVRVDDRDSNSGKDTRETSDGQRAPRQYYVIRYLQIQVNMISDISCCSLLEVARVLTCSHIFLLRYFLSAYPVDTHILISYLSVG